MLPRPYLGLMATTYNPVLSQSDPLHRARLALGDTGFLKDAEGTPKYLLLDEEITAKITALGYAEGVPNAQRRVLHVSLRNPTNTRTRLA